MLQPVWVSNFILSVELYLDHVHPLSHVKEALLTGDVVQQQHTVRPPEIRLCNAAKPERRKIVEDTQMYTLTALFSPSRLILLFNTTYKVIRFVYVWVISSKQQTYSSERPVKKKRKKRYPLSIRKNKNKIVSFLKTGEKHRWLRALGEIKTHQEEKNDALVLFWVQNNKITK